MHSQRSFGQIVAHNPPDPRGAGLILGTVKTEIAILDRVAYNRASFARGDCCHHVSVVGGTGPAPKVRGKGPHHHVGDIQDIQSVQDLEGHVSLNHCCAPIVWRTFSARPGGSTRRRICQWSSLGDISRCRWRMETRMSSIPPSNSSAAASSRSFYDIVGLGAAPYTNP